MSDNHSSGAGCGTIIVCVIIGIAIMRTCESETRVYYTSIGPKSAAGWKYHEQSGCPILQKEEPDPLQIVQVRSMSDDDQGPRVYERDHHDREHHRVPCSLCVVKR